MGVWQLTRSAWRDGLEAIRINASLFTLVLIVLMLVEFAFMAMVQTQMNGVAAGGPDAIAAAGRLMAATLPFTLVLLVVRSALLAPCAVAAHRLVLVDRNASHLGARDGKRMVRFTL